MCGMEESIVGRIIDAPTMSYFGSETLLKVAKEMEATSDKQSELIRKVELSAQAGMHSIALKSIYDIVESQDTTGQFASSKNFVLGKGG